MAREFSGILARAHQAWRYSRVFHSVRQRSSQKLASLTNSQVMLTLLVQELYSKNQQSSCKLCVIRNNMHLTGFGDVSLVPGTWEISNDYVCIWATSTGSTTGKSEHYAQMFMIQSSSQSKGSGLHGEQGGSWEVRFDGKP